MKQPYEEEQTKSRSCHIRLDGPLEAWLAAEGVKSGTRLSEQARRWLNMAYKYRHAIYEAENAPVRFVRDRSKAV
jgi:hypothetical protein